MKKRGIFNIGNKGYIEILLTIEHFKLDLFFCHLDSGYSK